MSFVVEGALNNQGLIVYVEFSGNKVVRCSQDAMTFINRAKLIFGVLSQFSEELRHTYDLCLQ